ncbi:hypothetical protein FACS1894208_02390 [Clostridia bacterium]|nr:hypothetical protein FACS1894208_02390 [Clostridia bacterium]
MSMTDRLAASAAELRDTLREQEYRRKQVERLQKAVDEAKKVAGDLEKEQLLVEKALRLIVEAGDVVAEDSYRFVTRSVNSLLEKMFTDCVRIVRLKQHMVGKNPTLTMEVVADGVTRDLSESSGHGIAQIVSLVCTICLIVLNGSRRIVVLDEVLSGISEQNKQVLSDALWAFTEIGFQFIVCEHNFVPDGARVYNFINNGGTSSVEVAA